VKEKLIDLLTKSVNSLTDDFDSNQILIERPKLLAHGDFSTNIALTLAKSLKKPPREIAQLIIDHLDESEVFEKIEIAGAGFINFYLNNKALTSIIQNILKHQEGYGSNTSGQNEKIQIEFVSANPTGPLHVGHGRGAAIGDCLARLFEFSGWQVTREFYYNDAGAQIDNLTKSVMARCNHIEPSDSTFPEDGYRGDYIKEIADLYLNKQKVVCEGITIQSNGDINDENLIKKFSVATLRNEQDKDLAAFNVKFDTYILESSFYETGAIDQVVDTLINNQLTYTKDDALWLETTKFGDDKDRVMKKSDGAYTYFVPDVAYHLNKWERGFKRVINEQGADHHSTINRVRAGLQGLQKNIPNGWPEYVLHQMITVMKNGEEVKISKRAGSYVTLNDLIDEVGCDATRYFLVARRPDSQLVFDVDLAKAQSNDNPVYYIQYAHARIEAVLNQSGEQLTKLNQDHGYQYQTEAEKSLIKKLSEFPDLVFLACMELAPHQIANYLKDCAAEFHSYYNDSKFLVDEKQTKLGRLSLIYATQQVIKNGLRLLGISAPNKM
jgi:arginyl-tRNA synthetase